MNCKYKSNFTKKKAFTLIELLVVIAIIGILFIVLVSRVDFATDKAKATGVQTDFRSFQMAFEQVSRERVGFNMFGWNTGDTNANGVRDSVDEGDTNKDGMYQEGETWTGRQKYLETWTNTYSLIRPGTTFAADGYDKDAIFALETAINKNLDPKLHITIDAKTGLVTMANGAQDPWNTQYHGAYISAEDGMDRGAIVMYSNGANQKFGSEHSIANGVPKVIVPDNNKNGLDDYSIAVVYTYTNGIGEIGSLTTGFSNNQNMVTGNGSNHITNVTPDVNPSEPEVPSDEPQELGPGLYQTGSNYTVLLKNWDVLVSEGILSNKGKVSGTGYSTEFVPNENAVEELAGDLLLPDTITQIQKDAFNGCINLTGVKLHDNITKIGTYAFYKSGITSITIPSQVTNIESAFSECDSLQSVELHGQLTNLYFSFSGCDALTEIVIPEGITELWSTFSSCANLSTVSLPSTMKKSTSSFMYCGSAIKCYFNGTIEQWCKIDFGTWAWGTPFMGGCNGLYINNELVTDPIIPESITTISGTFSRNTYITSVTLSSNLTTIQDETFSQCTNLTTVNFNNMLEEIGEKVFYGCTKLTDITLPNSVKSIGYAAFEGCSSLNNVFIPNSVETIASSVFRDTYATISWDPENSSLTTLERDAFYKTTIGELIIPQSLTTIQAFAFNEATYTSVHFHKDVQTIEDRAFSDMMDNVTTITIDESNPYFRVEKNCLISNENNTIILGCRNSNLNNTATSIGSYAFWGMWPWSQLSFYENITLVKNYAFNNCYNVTEVYVYSTEPPTLESSAFSNCKKLEKIYVPAESVDAYKNADGWSQYASLIQAIS